MYIWLGSRVDSTFVQCLFGLSNMEPEKVEYLVVEVYRCLFLVLIIFSVALLSLIIQYQKIFECY